MPFPRLSLALLACSLVACGSSSEVAPQGEEASEHSSTGGAPAAGGQGTGVESSSGGASSGGAEAAGGSTGGSATTTGGASTGGDAGLPSSGCAKFENGSGAANPCYIGVDEKAHCIVNDGSTVTLSEVPGKAVSVSGWDYTTRACVVNDGGAVYCGNYGSLSVWRATGATQVSGMSSGQCALVDGGVVCESGATLPATIETGSGEITTLGCFSNGCCAGTDAKELYCWGNTADALGTTDYETVKVTLPPGQAVLQIGAGQAHICALLEGGQVQCWGQDWNGQIGGLGANTGVGTTLVASGATGVASGQFHTCVAYAEGTVACAGLGGVHGAGQNSTALSNVPGITTALAITAGRYASCALLEGGTIQCWGDFGPGAPGTNETTEPIVVVGEAAVVCSAAR